MSRIEKLQEMINKLDSVVNGIALEDFPTQDAIILNRAFTKIELAMEEIETVIENI